MSRQRDMEHRIRDLGEIRDILNAMRNLALLETRKLARFLAAR